MTSRISHLSRPRLLVNRLFVCSPIMSSLLLLGTTSLLPAAHAADIGSQSGTSVSVNDGDRIIADAKESSVNLYGVMDTYGNKADIDLATNVTIDVNASAGFAKGIYLVGSGSALTADKLTVNVSTDKAAAGVYLTGSKNTADLGSGSSITVSGGSSTVVYGIMISSASQVKADNISIDVSGSAGAGVSIADYGSSADLGSGSSVKTSGVNTPGIRVVGLNGNSANGTAGFTATNLKVETQGRSAYGVEVQGNSIVDLGSNSVISTSGDYANGIWNLSTLTAEALTVTVTGTGSNAVEVRAGATDIGAGSSVSSAKGSGLVATGSNAELNYSGTADNRNSITAGGSAGASAQSSDSVINLKNTDIAVDAGGSTTLGLWALLGGVINAENTAITGAAGAAGAYAMAGGEINLTGNTAITMASAEQMAIATQYNAGYSPGRISAEGKMQITGGIFSRAGLIDVDMTSGSVWTGAAYSDNVNNGHLNISLTGSRWNVTADSNLDNLALNNSTVDLSQALSSSDYSTLTIADLSGNGTFVLRTDIVGTGNGADNAGDKVVVTGTSAGDYKLTVLNNGSAATTGNEVLTVVETADGAAIFSATSKVELGGYLYDVRQNGTNWELYSSGVAPTPDPEPKPNPPITTTADAGGNFLNTGYLLNLAETQTLMQRMGDVRKSDAGGNAWIRAFGGKFDSFASGKLSGFSMNYSGTQLGIDKRISPEIPLYVGAFAGLARGNPDYRGGYGTLQSAHLGLYATYLAENGFYADGLVKASRLKNAFTVYDSQNNKVAGSGHSGGYGISVEAGRRFALNLPADGFYVEPQVQLSFNRQNSAGVTAGNGLKIDLDGYNSFIGRTDVLLGYEKNTGSNSINTYLKTGFSREFAGNTAYRLNGSAEANSFKGNWWDIGLGVSATIRKAHNLYAELDSSTGHRFNHYRINAGYRFRF